jgi:hypothetical protein
MWNYRLIHKTDLRPGGIPIGEYVGVHEVHYDDAGAITHWTEQAAGVSGETVKEAQAVRIRMLEAWHQPILEWDELEKAVRARRRKRAPAQPEGRRP